MGRVPRREFVRASGLGCTVLASGCLGTVDRIRSLSPNSVELDADAGRWPMVGYDAQNTGHTPTTEGPTTGPNVRWSLNAGGTVSGSVAVFGGIVFIGAYASASNRLTAASAETGTVHWKTHTPHYAGIAPAVTETGILLSNAGIQDVFSFEMTSGSKQWVSKNPATGLLGGSMTIADGRIYYGSHSGHVVALDGETGEQEWRTKLTEKRISTTPAVGEEMVFVGSTDESLYALDTNRGTVQWKSRMNAAVRSAPVIAENIVYVVNDVGRFRAIDALTGEEQWQTDLPGFVIGASPAATPEHLYVGSNDASCYCLDAATGEIQWQFQTNKRVLSSPSVAGDTVYFGSTDGTLYALNNATGDQQWAFDSEAEITASPAIVDGTVYIGNEKGMVYALESH